jgi:hypothetical protein
MKELQIIRLGLRIRAWGLCCGEVDGGGGGDGVGGAVNEMAGAEGRWNGAVVGDRS